MMKLIAMVRVKVALMLMATMRERCGKVMMIYVGIQFLKTKELRMTCMGQSTVKKEERMMLAVLEEILGPK